MRTPCIILSLSLALISASTPAIAGTNILGWRLRNIFADSPSETGSIDSVTADRKVTMAANGYSLVSSTTTDGLTIEFWSPTSEDVAKRTPLLPESLPGAKRDSPNTPFKREPSLSPSDLRKRDSAATGLEKRDTIDIQGRKCSTICGGKWTAPDPNDCVSAYRALYNHGGVFTLPKGQAMSAISDAKNCSIWTINHGPTDITYDYWDAAGTGQWLNGDCVINNHNPVGVCLYEGIGTNVTNGVYTAVCHPTYIMDPTNSP